MPFSNVWDTTFPPDTQLANLLGQDIRQGVKVDVQQRMAAISGLDAAKPNFAGDAQPANWVGILFFATDTGKIYQFNNPAWTDVTGTLKAASTVLFKDNTQHVHTGTTTVDTVYTVAVPALQISSILRITLVLKTTVGAGGVTITTNLAGTALDQMNFNDTGGYSGKEIVSMLSVANRAALNSQVTSTIRNVPNGQIVQNGSLTTAVDTSVGTSLTITAQSVNNSDSQNFDSLLVELL